MRFAPVNIAYTALADCCFSKWLVLSLLIFMSQTNALANSRDNITPQNNSTSWVLAQNTSTTVGSTKTPRVISKPQTAVVEGTVSAQASELSSSTVEASDNPGDVVARIMAMLPESWQQKLNQLTGGTVNGSNDELVKKIALPVITVIAVLFLLPFVIVSLLKKLLHRRPLESVAATALQQERLADLDLDDIDLTAAVQQEGETTLQKSGERHADKHRDDSPIVESAEPTEKPSAKPTTAATVATTPNRATITSSPTQPTVVPDELSDVSAGNDDLSDNPAHHDATVELSGAELSQDTQTLKKAAALQPPGNATSVSKITPEQPGPKGQEEMTGMQQQYTDKQQTSTQPPQPATAQPMTKFGLWLLHELPHDPGAQYSTEALLYWISYGAGNVNPRLREELDNATELDDRGRIKRAVLSAKPEIFNDVLLSVKTRFSHAQQLQLLDLMLAVLVTGEGIKPVENLMLRFYCDYTGMGLETLENRYREGFDAELPGIPRPDRIKWWEKQPSANEHSAAASEAASKRLFGLPATASESQFRRAYKLAEHRHDASRFALLGEKQQSLALRNLQKYQAVLETRLEEEA